MRTASKTWWQVWRHALEVNKLHAELVAVEVKEVSDEETREDLREALRHLHHAHEYLGSALLRIPRS